MNNYEEKINNIKETEKYLLEMARNKILSQNKIMNLNIQDLICMLNYDDSTVKKYEATLKAQMLIEQFTLDIANATDVEEIKAIRNRLNYYINKIKSEVKEKNIPEEEYNKYYENATILRKNIATYIRFLKREDNIKEIDRLNNKDNRTVEEEDSLKKHIRLERNYGKKYTNPTVEKKVVKKEEKKNSIDMDKLIKSFNEGLAKKNEETIKPVFSFNLQSAIKNKPATVSFKQYENVDEYLEHRLISFECRYSLKKTNPYDGGIIHNTAALIKNVPRIIHNKEEIKRMKNDSCFHDRSFEFSGYINYAIHQNSVKENIKRIFSTSELKKKEERALNTHKRIIEWIKDYCDDIHCHIDYKRKVYE